MLIRSSNECCTWTNSWRWPTPASLRPHPVLSSSLMLASRLTAPAPSRRGQARSCTSATRPTRLSRSGSAARTSRRGTPCPSPLRATASSRPPMPARSTTPDTCSATRTVSGRSAASRGARRAPSTRTPSTTRSAARPARPVRRDRPPPRLPVPPDRAPAAGRAPTTWAIRGTPTTSSAAP